MATRITTATMIRADGGTPDIGYPTAVVLRGNDLVVIYHFNDGLAQERYIAASRSLKALACFLRPACDGSALLHNACPSASANHGATTRFVISKDERNCDPRLAVEGIDASVHQASQ